MESVTNSSKVKKNKKREADCLLIDPRVLFLFIGFLAMLIFLKHISLWISPQGKEVREADNIIHYKDARAFLFFEKADINQISLEGLVTIPGIGFRTAEKILSFRQQTGFLIDLNELMYPPGPLGPRKFMAATSYLETDF